MKRLGLIGGVSPESTVIYYRLLNDGARARLADQHSAEIILYALDYGVMIGHYDAADWDAYGGEIARAAGVLATAGAEALVICSNTSHLGARAAEEQSGLPVIHIVDATAKAMREKRVERPLLLGTQATMSGQHYLPELAKRYDGEAVAPSAEEQAIVGEIIFEELVHGHVRDASREKLLVIIDAHTRQSGVDGVILGCTELCMILAQEHTDLPVFDTTALHAEAACAFAFGET